MELSVSDFCFFKKANIIKIFEIEIKNVPQHELNKAYRQRKALLDKHPNFLFQVPEEWIGLSNGIHFFKGSVEDYRYLIRRMFEVIVKGESRLAPIRAMFEGAKEQNKAELRAFKKAGLKISRNNGMGDL